MAFSKPRRATLTVFIICCCSVLKPISAEEPRPAWTTSRIIGTPTPPDKYKLISAFPKLQFEKPTCIEELPGGRLLVTEIGGKVFSFPKEAQIERADLMLDLRARLPQELAGGNVSLFDAELHPDFSHNRFLFVCYVHPGEGGHTRLSRFTLDSNAAPQVMPDSEQVILTWPAGGHNGGCLEFGTDGYLYISTGDGSGPNPPDALTTGQDVSDLLGSILRIDVNHASDDLPYSIPADNPFIDLKGARAEIWAYGLRNPFKFGVDSATGNIFVADNGWESWELVHRIARGGNCGWPIMEGRALLRSEVKPGPTPILPPIKDHPHTEANSVIGGPVYRGTKLPDLVGSFVYGDYITGTIWSVRAEENDTYSHSTLVDTDQRVIAFTQGSGDELWVLDYDVTGQIYELAVSDELDNSSNFPRRLSETGLFDSIDDLEPAAGVVPYEVNASRWMDGASGQRWVAIPGSGRIRLATSSDEPAVYPEGTVFVKQISFPRTQQQSAIRVETQILHYENGVWHPYSYLWDESGQDAQLVESIGTSRAIQAPSSPADDKSVERTWRVNAVNECKLCHDAGPGFVLGFNPPQLNRPTSHDSRTTAQLSTLIDQQVIERLPIPAGDDPLRLVNPNDSGADLEDRARSYLHANCSMCHHPGGNAIVSFYLRRDLPFEQLNTNKGTGIGTFGINNAKIIAPGDPYRSILIYRMSKLGYARMPYIGSQVVDSAGVELVTQWIYSLKPESLDQISKPLVEDSAESKALHALANNRSLSKSGREKAVRTLIGTTEGSLALAMELHRGYLSEQNRDLAVAVGSAAPTSDIRGLFETFVPESQRRPTLGSRIDPAIILARQGDAARGKLIYYSDNARCRACHEVNDRTKSFGPTMQEINKKFMGMADMLQHVVQPSLKVDDEFKGYTVVTNDGKVFSGMLVEDNDTDIVIENAERRQIRIAREDIEEMQRSDQSLMPNQILSDLTAQEAADLFAYLQSLGTGE